MRNFLPLIGLVALLLAGGGVGTYLLMQDTGQRPVPPRVAVEEPVHTDPAPAPKPVQPADDIIRPNKPDPAKDDKARTDKGRTRPVQPVDEVIPSGQPDRTGEATTPEEQARQAQLRAERAAALKDELTRRAAENEKNAFTFTATISGNVVDNTGTPVAKVSITLRETPVYPAAEGTPTPAAPVSSRGRPGQRAATSDAAGNFTISFSRRYPKEPTSVAFVLSADNGVGGTFGAATAKPVEFSLKHTETKDGVRLEVPATGALVGRVVDGQGAPVPGATVTAAGELTQDTGGGNIRVGSTSRNGQTDANGQFRLEPIMPGAYSVNARKAGFRDAALTGKVTVVANQDTAIPGDLVLLGESKLRVTLTSAEGPIAKAGCTVTFYDAAGKPIRTGNGRADDNGVIVFGAVPENAVSFDLMSASFERTQKFGFTPTVGMQTDYGVVTVNPTKTAAKPAPEGDIKPADGTDK